MSNSSCWNRFCGVLLSFVLTGISTVVLADELTVQRYHVYGGTLDANGSQDLVLHRQDDLVLVPAATYLAISIPNDESYQLLGGSGGSFTAPNRNSSPNLSSVNRRNAGLISGDVNADGISDLLIQGVNAATNTVILAGSASGEAPFLIDQFKTLGGQSVALGNATLRLEDVNGDGFADIEASFASGATEVYENDQNGGYTLVGNPPPMLVTPPVPTGLSGPASSPTTSYQLSWFSVSGPVDSYELFRQGSVGGWTLEQKSLNTNFAENVSSSGTYQYQVRACLAGSCSGYTDVLTIAVALPLGQSNPVPVASNLPIPEAPLPNASLETIGATAAKFRVNEAGAATYSIPIFAAPGVAGVLPELGLSYSSLGGNGLVGQGWSIAGMSNINRCRQTKETDDVTGGVNFDAADRFCLDGQRLLLVPNTGTYGSAGSEYRTEIDSYTKIVLESGIGGHPNYFKAWRKDGSVTEYGNNNDSANSALLLPDGTTAVFWAQSRFEDSAGYYNGHSNPVLYDYEADSATGEHRIKSVSYANDQARIDFVYNSDRPDKRVSYLAGQVFYTNRRLERIESWNDGTKLRRYELTFKTGTHNGLSQLEKIQECGPSSCYRPTVFDWENESYGVNPIANGTHGGGYSGGRPADLDGDGQNELLFTSLDDGKVFIRLFVKYGNSWRESTLVQPIEARKDIRNTWSVIDYDNDGHHDLLYALSDGWYVRRGRSRNDQPDLYGQVRVLNRDSEEEFTVIADADGDGRADFLRVDGGQVKVQLLRGLTGSQYYLPEVARSLVRAADSGCDGYVYSCTYTPEEVKPLVLDFDGDGQADLALKEKVIIGCLDGSLCGNVVLPTRIDWVLYRAEGNQYVEHTRVGGNLKGSEIRFFDINGDGLPELVTGDVDQNFNNPWYYRLNLGNQFAANVSLGSFDKTAAEKLQILDFNGDGLGDLLYPAGINWVTRLNNGNGFNGSIATGVKAYIGDSPDKWHATFYDANGDGKLDAVVGDQRDKSGPNQILMYLGASAFEATNVIGKITNGDGLITNVTYKALTDPSQPYYYTKGTVAGTLDWGRGSAVIDTIPATYAVQRVTSSSPRAEQGAAGSVDHGAVSSISYAYAQQMIQGGGRGSLGFGTVISIDNQTGVQTHTVYSQFFPMQGRPFQTTTYTADQQKLSFASNVWADYNADGSNGVTRQPYLYSATDESYDLTVIDSLLTTQVTNTRIDDYGNAVSVDVITTDEVNSLSYRMLTSNEYDEDDVPKWWLGRLSKSTITHSRDGSPGPDAIRVSSFTYDPKTGQMVKEIVEPDGSRAEKISRVFKFDDYGNRTEITETGFGGDDPLDNQPAPSEVTRANYIHFDGSGRYITHTTDHFGRTNKTVLSRNEYGLPTQVSGYNGNVVDTAFDSMGRPYYTRNESGSFTATNRSSCFEVACPEGAVARVESKRADGFQAFVYTDVLGRQIRESKLGFVAGTYWVTVTEFDSLGRVKRVSEPFASSSAHTGYGTYWTTNTYDLVGRTISIQGPDGSSGTISYSGFESTYTDQEGKERIETRNALGDLARVEDHLDGFVSYTFNHQGQTLTATQGGPSAVSSTVTMGYDLLGRKTTMSDPDMGDWEYEYNSWGDLIKQTTAEKDYTQIYYDSLGRMRSRVDFEWIGGNNYTEKSDSFWIYDTSPNAIGKLHIEDIKVAGEIPFSRTFTYDNLSRLRTVETVIRRGSDYRTYVERTTYDQFGRVFQKFDASGQNRGTEHHYNERGYPTLVLEASTSLSDSRTLYAVEEMDARANVTKVYKQGTTQSFGFDPVTGRPDTIHAVHLSTQVLQDIDVDYDLVGNLKEKIDNSLDSNGNPRGVTETYVYDDLHRLDRVIQGSITTLDIDYDALGNIRKKTARKVNGTLNSSSNMGVYSYGARPHAVAGAEGISGAIDYNNNGSVTSNGGRQIEWTVFNKPTSFTKGSRSIQILYGPNRDRYQRIDNVGQASEITTHYVGNVERTFSASGSAIWRRYIDGQLVEKIVEGSSPSVELTVLLKDNLGSTDVLVDVAGNLQQSMSFDAFGMRRSTLDFSSLPSSAIELFNTSITNRGFTGHEALDSMGLVHMNGRVYDPVLGRFLSADSIIQAPNNTQSFNRYSYVFNNPLSYTDPSGNISVKQIVGIVVGAVITFYTAGAASGWVAGWTVSATATGTVANAAIAGALAGAAGGFASGAITTGSLKGAFRSAGFGALGGAAFGAIGQGLDGFAKVGAHALTGGVMSELQGGKFGHGFLSAGLTKAANVNNLVGHAANRAATRIIVSTLLAGSISQISGGKFVNGALSGAMAQILNGENDTNDLKGDYEKMSDAQKGRFDAKLQIFGKKMLGGAINTNGTPELKGKMGSVSLSVNADGKVKLGGETVEMATNVDEIQNEYGLKSHAFKMVLTGTANGNIMGTIAVVSPGMFRNIIAVEFSYSVEIDLETYMEESTSLLGDTTRKANFYNSRQSNKIGEIMKGFDCNIGKAACQ